MFDVSSAGDAQSTFDVVPRVMRACLRAATSLTRNDREASPARAVPETSLAFRGFRGNDRLGFARATRLLVMTTLETGALWRCHHFIASASVCRLVNIKTAFFVVCLFFFGPQRV